MFTSLPGFSYGGSMIESAAIRKLLLACRPSTVARLIVAVIVDAIQRMKTRRPRPHICEKVGEIFPTFTDFDSTASVILPVFVARIVASRAHINPPVVFGEMFATFCRTVRKGLGKHSVVVQTPTTARMAGSQSMSEDNSFPSALTLAKPCCATSLCSCASQDSKAGKFQPVQIFAPHGYILPRSRKMTKRNVLVRVAAFALLALSLGGIAQAQVALTQTTLASTVNGPSVYNGTATSTNAIDQVVFLASVAGINAPVLPGSPVSVIYVGREAMGVFTVNTSLKSVGVFRGYMGTTASPHPSGDMVLISNAYVTNQAFGANPVPSGLFNIDPPQGGLCLAAGTPTTPWVNVSTGAQWLCLTTTGTTAVWAPGFNNALCSGMGPACIPATAVASAATILPTGPLFHLTGTTAVVTITTPVGCDATAVGGCQFTAICDGVCAWTAAGNITTASGVMVAGTAVTFIWNPGTSKWIPNVTT